MAKKIGNKTAIYTKYLIILYDFSINSGEKVGLGMKNILNIHQHIYYLFTHSIFQYYITCNKLSYKLF